MLHEEQTFLEPGPARFMAPAPEEASLFECPRVCVCVCEANLLFAVSYLTLTSEAVYLCFQRLCSNLDVGDDLRLAPARRVLSAVKRLRRIHPSLPSNDPPGGPGAPSEDALGPERFITSEM